MLAIKTKNLTKDFRGVKALKGINLEIEEGEVFGLLGPNGAGKTTFINILATLLIPSGGSAKILDMDAVKDFMEIRKIIGYAVGYSYFWPHLTGLENVKFYATAYGVPVDYHIIKIMGMENAINKRISEYSSGMIQRLSLIVANLHRPKVLLLDEPTIGLDPNSAKTVRKYIRGLKSNNTTILITTHNMFEAEEICDRIGIIYKGKIIALGSPSQLKKKYKCKTLEEVFVKLTGMHIEV